MRARDHDMGNSPEAAAIFSKTLATAHCGSGIFFRDVADIEDTASVGQQLKHPPGALRISFGIYLTVRRGVLALQKRSQGRAPATVVLRCRHPCRSPLTCAPALANAFRFAFHIASISSISHGLGIRHRDQTRPSTWVIIVISNSAAHGANGVAFTDIGQKLGCPGLRPWRRLLTRLRNIHKGSFPFGYDLFRPCNRRPALSRDAHPAQATLADIRL